MPSLISPTQLKAHVASTLSDEALQQIIDGEEQEMVRRFGAHTSEVEEFTDDLPDDVLYTRRFLTAVSEIVETQVRQTFIGAMTSSITLSADDYEILPDGSGVRRLQTGTNPAHTWGQRVKITYTPEDETAMRTLALINLCKVEIQFNGMASESVGGGEYSYQAGNLTDQKERIYRTLAARQKSIA